MLKKIFKKRAKFPTLSCLFSTSKGSSNTLEKFEEGYLSYIDSKRSELPYLKKSIENKNRNIIHLTGVPEEWSEFQTHRYFDPKLENIEKIVQIKDSIGRKTPKCLIYAKDKKFAEKFVKRYNNDFINTEEVQNHLRCHIFDLKTQKKRLKQMDAKGKLMIYNIAFEATNVEIGDICKSFGNVKGIYMPLRAEDRNNGYAIVEFDKVESAKEMMIQVKKLF